MGAILPLFLNVKVTWVGQSAPSERWSLTLQCLSVCVSVSFSLVKIWSIFLMCWFKVLQSFSWGDVTARRLSKSVYYYARSDKAPPGRILQSSSCAHYAWLCRVWERVSASQSTQWPLMNGWTTLFSFTICELVLLSVLRSSLIALI